MSKQSAEIHNWVECPRFVTKRLPRSLGWVLVLVCGVVTYFMALSAIGEPSVIMIILSILLTLCFGAATLVGILSLMASQEKLRISREGIQVCLGKLVLWRIPGDRIRSVVAGTREIRLGLSDRQVVLLQVYRNGGIGGGKHPFWMEWSPEAEDALRRMLPGINLLL